jgi:hypothetical protein
MGDTYPRAENQAGGALIDRTRLIKLLGMLGSVHDGERSSAAALADKLVRAAGLTWSDVILPIKPAEPARKPRSWDQEPEQDDWRDIAEACAECAARLTKWERRFLDTLLGQHWISTKQRAVLDRIAEKAGVEDE